jgi:hypothetical protein
MSFFQHTDHGNPHLYNLGYYKRIYQNGLCLGLETERGTDTLQFATREEAAAAFEAMAKQVMGQALEMRVGQTEEPEAFGAAREMMERLTKFLVTRGPGVRAEERVDDAIIAWVQRLEERVQELQDQAHCGMRYATLETQVMRFLTAAGAQTLEEALALLKEAKVPKFDPEHGRRKR